MNLKKTDKPPLYFESHPNDSRVTGPYNIGCTVSARYGTGGGNTPIVLNVGQRWVLGEMEERRQGVYPSRNGLQGSSGDSYAYFRAVSFGEYVESTQASTLRAKGGDVGVGGVKDCSSVGFDQHNLNLTGSKAMTLLNARADGHSVPTVFQRLSDDS